MLSIGKSSLLSYFAVWYVSMDNILGGETYTQPSSTCLNNTLFLPC